jgi:hypothetical protein
LLCVPQPGKRAHAYYGFDLDAVPSTHCLLCDTPIAGEPYVIEVALARFGTMQFLHERCATGIKRRRLSKLRDGSRRPTA